MSETLWDAPNQQVVRPDESAPWDEGTGGGEDVDGVPDQGLPEEEGELEAMTKQELLDRARELGVSPANNDMTKQELIDAIRADQR